MSAISENIPVNWISPHELKHQLETACKFEFLGGAHYLNSMHELYDSKVIGYASTFFAKLPPQMTHWYTALEELNFLPDSVPALPENFFEIYFGNCPIKEMEGQLKRDKTPYKVYETHSLFLIPPNNLHDLDGRLLDYFEKELGREMTLPVHLGFCFIDWYDPKDKDECGHIASNDWEWVLIPNKGLEESQNKNFSKQLKIIKKLNKRVKEGPNYRLGTFKQMAMFHSFYRVVTGISLDRPIGIGPQYYIPNYTSRVQEFRPSMSISQHMTISCRDFLPGSFSILSIVTADYIVDEPLGIAVLRNLLEPSASRPPAEELGPGELGTQTACSCLIS